MAGRTTVIGFLGLKLDAGQADKRWRRWRPTIAACQHEDLLVDRFELLHPSNQRSLAVCIRNDIADVSPETDVHFHEVDFKDPWDFEEVFTTLHQFARSYKFNTNASDYLFNITTGTHVQQICLFLLAESRHLPGRLLQLSPPRKSSEGVNPGRWSVIDLDLARYDAIAQRFTAEQQEGQDFLKSGIATRNAVFNQMIERIEQVSISSTAPILLTGPTGAGKTALARRIYELKRRREQISGRFVEVNCATLRGDQAMSALFGHSKGAFTGATSTRQGLLKAADAGLLFLDEVGELGLDEQAMFLRAIEEKRFLPVGSDNEIGVDFQLIAGTNRNLLRCVQKGEFREDLLARINLWSFELPGLMDRAEDIEPNVDYELERLTTETGRKISMSREARDMFLEHATSAAATWAGNFRDLGAAMTRMATLSDGGRIGLEQVREEWQRLTVNWMGSQASTATDTLRLYFTSEQLEQMDRFDQVQLGAVLDVCRQSPSMAAAGRWLFAASRASRSSTNDSDRLRKYLGRFDLTWKDVQEGAKAEG